MSTWKHLFVDGEFSPRMAMLSGLTFEQVTERPAGASNSIYEELWHVTKWQTIVVERDRAGGDAWLAGGPHFPGGPPDREQAWHDLVKEFLAGAERAVAWGESPEGSATQLDVGWTMKDALQSLAVHSAYHLGKIVALRQRIGAWPPPPTTERDGR